MKSTDHDSHSEHLISTEHCLSLHFTQVECLSNFKLLIRLAHLGQERREVEADDPAEVEDVAEVEGNDLDTSLSFDAIITSLEVIQSVIQ